MMDNGFYREVEGKYSTMATEELVRIYEEGNITETAKELLEKELNLRGHNIDPLRFGIEKRRKKRILMSEIAAIQEEKRRRRETLRRRKEEIKKALKKLGLEGGIVLILAIIIILMILFPPFNVYWNNYLIGFGGYHIVTFAGLHRGYNIISGEYKIYYFLLFAQIVIVCIFSLIVIYINRRKRRMTN